MTILTLYEHQCPHRPWEPVQLPCSRQLYLGKSCGRSSVRFV